MNQMVRVGESRSRRRESPHSILNTPMIKSTISDTHQPTLTILGVSVSSSQHVGLCILRIDPTDQNVLDRECQKTISYNQASQLGRPKASPKVVFAPKLASSDPRGHERDPRGHECASKGAATNVRDRLQFGPTTIKVVVTQPNQLTKEDRQGRLLRLSTNNDQRNCRLPNHPGRAKTATNVVFRPGPVRQESV